MFAVRPSWTTDRFGEGPKPDVCVRAVGLARNGRDMPRPKWCSARALHPTACFVCGKAGACDDGLKPILRCCSLAQA